MDIYVINLPKNKERLYNFMKKFYASDINHFKMIIFEAINGKQLDLSQVTSPEAHKQILETEKTGYRTHHHHLTRGGVGCYSSHLEIYKDIVKKNKDMALIFEDDSNLPLNIHKLLVESLYLVPLNWDMINLSCNCIKCTDKVFYKEVERFFLMNCYIINNKGARKILDYHANKKIDKQIDSELSLMSANKQLNVYCTINPYGQAQYNTDIQVPISSGLQDPLEMSSRGSCGIGHILIIIFLILIGIASIILYFSLI